MGLKFIGAVDLATFMNDVQTEQTLAEEFAFDNGSSDSSQSPPFGVYIDQLDRHFHRVRTSAGVPGPGGDHRNKIRMPVLLGSVKSPDVIVGQGTTPDKSLPMVPGDPLRPGGQKVYATEFGPDSIIETMVLLTMLNDGAPAFPTVNPADGPINLERGTGAFVVGPGSYFGGPKIGFSEFARGRIIFEGLTDGIPGETNLVGSGVYPKGLMLGKYRTATCPAPIGTGVAGDCDHAISWQDLDVGGIDGRLINTPGIVSSSDPNSEAPIQGKEFSWYPAQYVPDVDATFGTPKGELMFFSDRNGIGVDPSLAQSIFVKIIDFNPFGVAPTGGAPNRVHERVRLVTTADFDISPMFGVGGAGDNDPFSLQLSFHPPSQRFYMIQADNQSGVTTPGPAPGGESFIGYWLRAVDPIGVTSPVARDVPRTNDIIEYEAFVGGSLSEPAAGVDVDWTLFRNSTELEVIVPVFPGFNDVANTPIDGDFAGSPEGTLVVLADSVLLVEGVDYTVTLFNGRITWITDQTGATLVEASYEHRGADASPPHGTLLSGSSQTDIDGRVFTQVRFPDDDDIVGKIDRLRAVLA